VLDPFAGSGTTLTVAKKLARRFLGFELSPEYSARVQQRLAATRRGAPLEGVAEPLRSVPNTENGRRLDRVRLGDAHRRNARSSAKNRELPGLLPETD
jgi:hypothetical protein